MNDERGMPCSFFLGAKCGFNPLHSSERLASTYLVIGPESHCNGALISRAEQQGSAELQDLLPCVVLRLCIGTKAFQVRGLPTHVWVDCMYVHRPIGRSVDEFVTQCYLIQQVPGFGYTIRSSE